MTAARFRSVDSSGESTWFENADSVRKAYRAGVISAESLLYDEKLDRWHIVRDHEILAGIEPSTAAPTTNRARSVPPPPRVSERQAESPRQGASAPQTADGRSSVKRRVAIIAVCFVAIVIYLWRSAPSSQSQASTEPQPPVAVVPVPTLQGFVTNYGTVASPSAPLTSKLTVDLNPTDRVQAQVLIAPPLGGSGRAEVAYWSDTLVLGSLSAAGDSIVWFATAEGGRFVGSYFIFGGSWVGQGGRWWVARNDRALTELATRPGRPDDKTVEVILQLTRPFQGFALLPD